MKQMRHKLLLHFAIGLALLGCQNVLAHPRSNIVLRIEGKINKVAFEKVSRFLKRGGRDIVVNSVGGDARFGQKIAAALLDLSVGVSVERYCLSSCANYLFLAASRKRLQLGAVLGFHGGVEFPEQAQMTGVASTVFAMSLAKLQETEREIFERMGVDYRLIRKSFELVKSDENRIYVEFNGNVASRQVFDLSQKEEAMTLIAERLKLEANTKWSIQVLNVGASSKMYFPSEQTLRDAGVKGLERYPYPKSKEEMTQLATEIGIELVGDFVDES